MQQKLLTGLFSLMVLLVSCKHRQQLPSALKGSLDTVYHAPYGFNEYIARISFTNNSDAIVYLKVPNEIDFIVDDTVDSRLYNKLIFLMKDSNDHIVPINWNETSMTICELPEITEDLTRSINLHNKFIKNLTNENMQVRHLKSGTYVISGHAQITLNMVWNSSGTIEYLEGKTDREHDLEAALHMQYSYDNINMEQYPISFTSPMLDKVFLEE